MCVLLPARRRQRQHFTTPPPIKTAERCCLVHTSNNVEATFDCVESTCDFVAFDNVDSTLLLVWTGFNVVGAQPVDNAALNLHLFSLL